MGGIPSEPSIYKPFEFEDMGASADADRALVPSGPEPQSVSADSGNGPLRVEHRWSGWPGAWCLDCGISDPIEQAIADDEYDPYEDGWRSQEAWKRVEGLLHCSEPGSDRHNPYALGIEARSGETHSGSTEGESPTLEEGNAQTSLQKAQGTQP